MASKKRLDREGTHESAFKKNKIKIIATQDICGICGKPVDKSLKFPNPFSPTVDHIIPVAKGGHPSDISNLQLAHFCCNRQKSDKLFNTSGTDKDSQGTVPTEEIGNDVLPLTYDYENLFK